ncbi:mechanosensitive ion channel domain-containing protein [Acuticoccus yangtzensis]|uniref:mechanosensitive ion channel domain-containing protein n=1 Tax=Acuticoccus yangtzensis TaxID=1443441 RepID=UPI00094980F1|nr:mechanosensitive ion channel domain-containing protein [Acuticoccus yangtzensis]ORE95866.1 mechanosensitive ion channel MscS [Stappia sp. 22II-S9-Z10]
MVSIVVRFCLAILVSALVVGASQAQTVDLAALKRQLAQIEGDTRNVDIAIERQRAENARLINVLSQVRDTGQGVTFEELRQAQFEVDIARTRLLTLAHRLTEQDQRADQLSAQIVSATAALRANERDTLQRILDEAAIDWRDRIRTASTTMMSRLATFQALSAEYLNLREEQLSILQRYISLDALAGVGDVEDSPVVTRLRRLVNQLAQQAITLSNEAANIVDGNPAAVQRRNLLRLRSDEALLRSNTRLTDIAIVESRSKLAALQPIREEPSIPIRLFDEAIDTLEDALELLAQRAETIALNRDGLGDLSRILAEPTQDAVQARALSERINALSTLLDDQAEEIGSLQEQIGDEIGALSRERAVRERAVLLTREVARTDQAARERIAAEVATIPQKLRDIYESRMLEVMTAVEVAPQRTLILFGAVILVLLAFTFYLRQSLLRRFISADATRATEIPLEVVRRNLFWLFPVAAWYAFAVMFQISEETTMSILKIIVIPAVAASLRDFTQVIVSRQTYGQQRRIGTIITRATEIAVVLSAAFVLAYVVLGELNLLPSTETAINRLAYSVFVLSGLPMLLFVFFFTASRGGGSYGHIRRYIAAVLSLLPPVALIATGVTGLLGYTRLAVMMLENLGLAILIIAALALAVGILNDLMEGITARIRTKDPARAFFARANFLQPLNRAAQIVLLAVTIAVCVQIFGFTAETPVIREVVTFWQTSVFTAGGTTYTIGSVIIAALAFAFVFWVAGWSRRVAYTVVFGKMKDIGIRQSLSVFAQYVVVVIGVIITLSAIGFDITTLTVFAASLGVGIGFGLQNVVNNFISGLLLLVERPLRIGDIVTVGANSGTVMQIGIRSMRMKTFDEFDLIVPNSALISDTFTNWTRTNSVMRVILMVGIGYGDDPDLAISLVYDALEEHPGVLKAPAPMVTVEEFGDNSINLRVCYYIDLYGNYSGFKVKSEVLTRVVRSFGANGVSIPFPQRDIHVITPRAAPEVQGSTTIVPRDTRENDWVADAIEAAGVDSDDDHGGKDPG